MCSARYLLDQKLCFENKIFKYDKAISYNIKFSFNNNLPLENLENIRQSKLSNVISNLDIKVNLISKEYICERAL